MKPRGPAKTFEKADYQLVASHQIYPKPPFHFDGTFCKQSHFPNNLDRWEPGLFHQTIRVANALLGVRCRDTTQNRRPSIEVSLFHPVMLPESAVKRTLDELAFRYDLNADLSEFISFVGKDPRFANVFRRWKGMRASTQYSLYELLVVGLILQNTQVRRSVQMLQGLTDEFGTTVRFDKIELQSLWLPERLEHVQEEHLRTLKIGYRAHSLKRFSQQFTANQFDEVALRRWDDESLKLELLKIYSVGPETVRILMSEGFHRRTALSHVAPWQQKIYCRLFYDDKPVTADRIMADINRQFGKYAGLAVHYIWEDIFWLRRSERIPWLEAEIRL